MTSTQLTRWWASRRTPPRPWPALLAAVFFLLSCGGDAVVGGLAGEPCDPTAPCAPGLGCHPDGTCVMLDDGGVLPGDLLADGGSGWGVGHDGGDVCGTVGVTFDPVLPTVILLIDQSGSMDESFGGTNRWAALKKALIDPDIGVVTTLDDVVIFGATLYTSHNGYAGGTCPELEVVDPVIDNYDAVAALLNTNSPESDTPTAESIAAVYPTFPPVDPETPEPRLLVLATDGNPDNCDDADAHNLVSQGMSETEVQNAFAAGIKTIVLSVGDDVALPHLQRMANAGVGADLDTGTEPYYVALNPEELVNAFSQIIWGVRTCTFTVAGTVDLDVAPQASVWLNGDSLVYGTDWTMVDESTMELLGDACDAFLTAESVNLSAEFPCGSVVLF